MCGDLSSCQTWQTVDTWLDCEEDVGQPGSGYGEHLWGQEGMSVEASIWGSSCRMCWGEALSQHADPQDCITT